MIVRTPSDASPQRYRLLRQFMIAAVVIAVISGAAGYLNAGRDEDAALALDARIAELESQLSIADRAVQAQRTAQAQVRGVLLTLQRVVASKELAAAQSRSEELLRDVDTLKGSIADLLAVLEATTTD